MSNYRKKCLEAKGTVCAASECNATEGIEVHHLDGDRANNDISNLVPLCRACHSDLHRRGLDGLEGHLKPVSERSHIDQSKTTFGLSVDREKWAEWKRTVPREKSLEKRIIELVEADTEGRVQEAEEE